MKKSDGNWSTNAKKVFVKASDGLWKSAARVFAKTTNGWVQMWPGDAPAINQSDPINIRSGGYNGTVVGSPQYINAVLYGHDSNGGSITGATPISIDYRKMKIASDDTGQTTRYQLESTDIYNLTSNSETNVAEKRYYADGWWLFYELSATNVWGTSILYSFPPIKIISRIPVFTSSTLTEDYSFINSPSFSLDFTISDLWYQAADWSRSYVRWWKNTSKTPGGTILKTEYLDSISGYTATRGAVTGGDPTNQYPQYNGSGTTYNGFSVYIHNTALAGGEYIIAEVVLQNSYTDHYGTPVSNYKSTGDRPVIISQTVRDDNGNGVVDNQSDVRIISDGYLNFTAIVNGAQSSDYYLLEPRFYNWQNGTYYRFDTFATQTSTSWPVDLTPTSTTLSGTTATVKWRIYINADSLYGIAGPTYSSGLARWSLEWRISTRASSSTSNALASYYTGFPNLGGSIITWDPDSIDVGADAYVAPSSAMTLNVSSTTIQQGNSVTFSGTTTSYPSGYASYPKRYYIDYGDGTTSGWNSFATGTSNPSFSGITKTYSTAGTYTATLYWEPQGDPSRSTRSRTITVSPPLSPPTSVSVSNVSRYSDTETKVDLSHSGGSGPYYQMYWIASSTTPTTASYDAASNTSSTSISEAYAFANNTTYYFYVRSSSENIATTFTNGTGTAGTYSNYSSISPNPSYTFQHPSGSVSVSPSSGTAGTTTFTATASISGSPSPNISYQWQYYEGGQIGWATAPASATSPFTSTSSTYTPPSNFVTFYGSNLRCLVTANNGVTSTTNSYQTAGSATVNAPATKLSTPTSVTATSNRSDGVQVSWTNVTNASTYGVWYGSTPSYDSTPDYGGPNNNGGKTITSSPFLDDIISSGSSRTYYVQAFPSTSSTTYLKSDWSSPGATGTRVAAKSTPSITNVQKSGSSYLVTVSGGSGAPYQVWWQTSSSTPSNCGPGDAQTASGNTVTVTNLTASAGTTYYFFARSTSSTSTTDCGPSATASSWSSGYSYTEPAAPVQYTVTWNATFNGGTGGGTTGPFNAGSTHTAPSASKSGSTLNGWYTATSGGTLRASAGGSYVPTQSETLYAQYTASSCTCSYSDYGTYYYSPGCCTPTTLSGLPTVYNSGNSVCSNCYTLADAGSCCNNINKRYTKCSANDVTSSSSPVYFYCYSTGQCINSSQGAGGSC